MKKLHRYVLIMGLTLALMMLSACQKSEAPAEAAAVTEDSSQADVTEETVTPEPQIEEAKTVAPEPTEANKEEEAETTDAAENKEEAASDTADEPATDETKQADVKTEDTKGEANEAASLPLKDVYNKIAGSVSLPEMYFADAGFLMNYYGIDSSKLEDYVFASSLDSTRADSVILIRLKDESSADEVVGGLNMVLEQMSIELENYNPEANELVKAAKVRRNGKNIDLIIHSDRNTILSIIDSSL